MLNLIEHVQFAIDELIDAMGRATIEAVLLTSIVGVADPKQQSKKSDVVYHGSQAGRVTLKESSSRGEAVENGETRAAKRPDPGREISRRYPIRPKSAASASTPRRGPAR
jgi:hypothetical protein